MSDRLGQRAVVVGVGIGGLSMAGAMANHFEKILERDRLTAEDDRVSAGETDAYSSERLRHRQPCMAQRAADDFKAIRARLLELQHTRDGCHHRYVDGRCYACGAADPNGKPF